MSASINTIPASFYVSVTPSVISGGGAGLQLVDLMLTANTRVPVGQVLSFPNLAAVQSFFGATSNEAAEAAVYFAGYTTATIQPGALLFTQYPIAPVGAYLRGGNISGLSLASLQAISGVLTVTVDGTSHTSSSINLSSATSFSNAAQIISTALAIEGPPVEASFEGSFGATFVATGSGTNLTVASVTSGGIVYPGAAITGTGVPASTTIVSQTSGTAGGPGVYVTSAVTTSSAATITAASSYVFGNPTSAIPVGSELTGTGVTAGTYTTGIAIPFLSSVVYPTNNVQTVAQTPVTPNVPPVTYDSVSGGFVVVSGTTGASSTISYGSGTISAGLALTQATGAVLSQGAIAAVPASFMANILTVTTNWATFQTLFDPDAGSGNTQKQAFAAWVNTTGDRYLYMAWDTDITPTESTAATSSLGYILKSTSSSGTAPIYQPVGANLHLAAFLGGYAASIDYSATNGRATADFKSQTGLVPSVTSATVAANLTANGYNYYASVATAGQGWQFFDPGQVSGPFSWIDSYLDQIWLNSQCQVALMNMLTTYGTIPYNPTGYGYIRAALTGGAGNGPVTLPPQSPVAAAINNGVIAQNVPLSAAQASEVNALAGMAVASTIQTQGFYLVIQPATSQVRAARGSPTIILLYTDGESLQRVNLSSVLIQ